MKSASTIPSSLAIKNGSDVVITHQTPKGRYKNITLSPRPQYPAPATLSPGFIRSFGFASRTFQPEASEASIKTSQDLSKTDCDKPNAKSPSPQCSDRSISASSIAPATMQNGSVEQAQNVVLSESRLNFMSHNLSEIADRVSPTKFDVEGEDDVGSSETSSRKSQTRSGISAVNSDQSRTKTPYSRSSADSKSYVSRQKSFTRRRTRDRRLSNQETNNGELSRDADHNHIRLREVEHVKLEAETDSGYNSSFSTSISLSEEIEASKRLSLDNGSNTDVETDELLLSNAGEHDIFKERLHDADALSSQRTTQQKSSHSAEMSPERTGDHNVPKSVALPSHKTSDLEERIDSLLHGTFSDLKDVCSESTVSPQKARLPADSPDHNVPGSNDYNTTPYSFKLSGSEGFNVVEGKAEVGERSNSSPDAPFQLPRGKDSQDDRSLARTKNARRPGILRRRSTLVSFRPPKQMTVQEGESDVVEMDEAGFRQLLTDMKSLKTQLLKLKRELQEADVVSPLSHSHSCLVRRPSAPLDSDQSLSRVNSPHGKQRVSLKRNMTMDAAAMQEKLYRSAFLSGAPSEDNAEDTNAVVNEFRQRNEELVKPPVVKETSSVQEDKEMKKLRAELEEVKTKLIETSQEKDSLVRQREELEHELDSKNHTIRMLQKQLEVQDNQDEMAYLKRQVKSLTDQIQQQQKTITGLRYGTASPSPVTMATVSTRFQQKKDLVKADIRNRLRDAFVRHLGESSRNHTQLSKHIQKAERNIGVAQKGLCSLCSPSSRVHSHRASASTGHLPEDKSGSSSKRLNFNESQEDSDGGEPESYSAKSNRCQTAVECFERKRQDSDGTDSESQSCKSRHSVSPKFESHSKEIDGSASESDSGKGTRRWLTLGSEIRGDSDGTDSESHPAKSRRWRSVSRGVDRDKEEDGSTSESDSGRVIRRWLRASTFEKSKEHTHVEDFRSRPSMPNRRHTKSPSSEGAKCNFHRSDLDSQSAKLNRQRVTPSASGARKTSHSKYPGSTLDAALLSHSWAPGSIEKIVKSWRDTKSPEPDTEAKEKKALQPVAHVEFL